MNVGQAIELFLKRSKLYDKVKEAELISRWEKLMGPMVSSRTSKLYINDRVLYVRLESAVLRAELELGKEKLVRLLNEDIGEEVVRSVRFI